MNETTQLLQLWYAGDGEAAAKLLDLHYAFILNLVNEKLGPRLRTKVEPADLTQQAILSVLVDIPRFKPRDGPQFRAFLCRIVTNRIKDTAGLYSAKRRDIEREFGKPMSEPIDLDAPNPHRILEQREFFTQIRFLLELLSLNERLAFCYQNQNGLSVAEIGQRLGVSTERAATLLKNSRENLGRGLRALRRGEIDGWLTRIEDAETDDDDPLSPAGGPAG